MHGITSEDRVITVGDRAWHRLDKNHAEHMTPEQAYEAAGLDWTVEEAPLTGLIERGSAEAGDLVREHIECATHKLLVRSDNKKQVGVVGSGYQVFQNSQLAALVNDVIGPGPDGEPKRAVETAGSLKGGRIVWFLLAAKKYDVAGVDPLNGYSLFANGHDGSLPIRVLPTATRVVCWNTYRVSGAENLTKGVTIKHTLNADLRLDAARRVLTQNAAELEQFHRSAEALAAVEVDTRWLQEFFLRAFIDGGMVPPTKLVIGMSPEEAQKTERANRRAAETIAAWHANFEDADGGDTSKKIATTAWGALNAVTRWASHGKPIRGEKDDPSLRTFSNFFGSSAEFTSSSLQAATEMITA